MNLMFVTECMIAIILYMAAAASISISYVVSRVAPIPGRWCLDDLGREIGVWVVLESEEWRGPIPQGVCVPEQVSGP